MKTSDFYYELPEELIAQTPLEHRDHSRLLTLNRETGKTGHHHFYELPEFLKPGDCLVLNNSRVLPARLLGHREPTGGAVELLLLKDLGMSGQARPQVPHWDGTVLWRRPPDGQSGG